MNALFQNCASLLNMGLTLSAIDPQDGLLAPIRLEDGFATLPMAMDRTASFSFAMELADAAQTLSRNGSRSVLIGERNETDFPRLHYLTDSYELWRGRPAGTERTRLVTTREVRELSYGDVIPHGDVFTLVCAEELADPRSLSLGKMTRGFRTMVSQIRKLSMRSPVCERDEVSELTVESSQAGFWRNLLSPGAELSLRTFFTRDSLWGEALSIASALYMEDPDLLWQGFEIRTPDRRPHRLRFDDLGRPYVPGWNWGELESCRPRVLRSVSKVEVEGVVASAIEIDPRRCLLQVRERRVGAVAGTAHPFLAAAVLAAKEEIEKEMGDFEDADGEVKRATLEREKYLLERGPRSLV